METIKVETDLGPIWFRGRDTGRAILLVVASEFSSEPTMERLQALFPALDVLRVHLPGNHCPLLVGHSIGLYAAAYDMALDQRFPGRAIVVLGLSAGGLVALGLHAQGVKRVIAVDPPLVTREAWPLARLKETAPAGSEAFLAAVLGVGVEGDHAPDYRPLLDRLTVPTIALLADPPPEPGAVFEDLPGLVGPLARAALRARRSIEIEEVHGASHNILRVAPGRLLQTLVRTLRQAFTPGEAAGPRPDPAALAQQLATRVPLDAQHILYVGPARDAFEITYASRNPQAAFLRPGDGRLADLLVIHDTPNDTAEGRAGLAQLGPEGTVVALAPLGPSGDALPGQFDSLTLIADDPQLGLPASVLVRARRGPLGRRTRVELVTYAPTLMDIRTRLPAEELRTDPRLEIAHRLKTIRSGEPGDHPRVLVVQRPPGESPDVYSGVAAHEIARGSVLVIEHDDHPEIVARLVHNMPLDPARWGIFSAAHAIQTSTEELATVFRAHNPEVAVFPNAAFTIRPFPTGGRPRRVFYGCLTRGPFAQDVARALLPAIAATPDVEFVVVGDKGVFDALPTTRKSFHDYLAYADYLDLMSSCSVSLAPLDFQPMLETKSDAKYIDAARAGVLTIASPLVYGRTIQSGVNGLIAETLEDWPRLLSLALADEALRERLAREAWTHVRDHRMFKQQISERRAWYESLLERQAPLSRAMVERCPLVAAKMAAAGRR